MSTPESVTQPTLDPTPRYDADERRRSDSARHPCLRNLGYPTDEAQIIVDQLIDNALCGYKFAGLPRILAIAGDAKTRNARTPVRIVHETPVSALLDGGNNVGYIAAYRGAEVAIKKAREMGIASSVCTIATSAGAMPITSSVSWKQASSPFIPPADNRWSYRQGR